MEFICFFIVISCAIYGAAELLHIIYAALVSLLARLAERKGGGRNRRT